jgi:hypothetical protein
MAGSIDRLIEWFDPAKFRPNGFALNMEVYKL